MPTEQTLEEQLAAIKTERETKATAREASTTQKVLADKIARERRGMADDETFATLLEEHGVGAIKRINSREGMVVVKSAHPLVHKRFADEVARTDHPNPKVRTSMHDASEKFARHCLVHPDKATFDAMAEKVPGLIATTANEAYELGKPQVEEDEGK